MILKHFKLLEMENDRNFIYESRAGKFSKICRFLVSSKKPSSEDVFIVFLLETFKLFTAFCRSFLFVIFFSFVNIN